MNRVLLIINNQLCLAAESTNHHKARKEASEDSAPDSHRTKEANQIAYLDNHSTQIMDRHLVEASKAATVSVKGSRIKPTRLAADEEEEEAMVEEMVEDVGKVGSVKANRTTKVLAAHNKTTLEEAVDSVDNSQLLVGSAQDRYHKGTQLALVSANSRTQVASAWASNRTSLNRTLVDLALASRVKTRINQRSAASE